MPHPLLLLVLVTQAPPPGGGAVYRNNVYGFQLGVPAGWTQEPDSVLHDRVLRMRRNGASESETNYVAAFTRTPGRWTAYPYVLVQVNDVAADDSQPGDLASVAAELNSMTGGVARYDSGQHAVLFRGGRGPARAGQVVLAFAGIRLTDRALVSVLAYGMEQDSLDTEAIRDRFLAALKVDRLPLR